MSTAFASLADKLESGPIPLPEAVRIFASIAEAVDHAAGQGVLHPRLGPSSIVFDEQNNPSLGDTGLATRGAPEYMSPEEIHGETPDARADVYSLAALAYHALTGRPPFEGVTEQGILFKQATEPPRPPRELRPDLPEGIDAVLLQGLAKRPDDRYQTATEFARALSTAAESRRELETTRPEEAVPITASAPPPSSELPKWVAEEEATPADTPPTGPVATLKKRGFNPWLILFILLGLVLRFGINGGSHPASYDYSPTPIPVGLLTRFWNAEYSPDGKQIIASLDDMTVRVWDAATITEQAEQLGRGGIREAEFSPDGTRILTTDEDTGSHEYFASVWDARLGTELLRLSGHTAHLFSARYNPQGTQIVTASMDGSARVWDAATGKQQLLLRERGYSILTAHYSPDGKQVALEGAEHHVEIWDATSAKLLISFSACNSVAYSPDSKRMVLVQDNDTASVLDTETWRNLLVLTGHEDAVRGATYSPDGTQIVTRSADRTARIWDAETGKQLAILVGHDREVSAEIYSPDSRYIVTATYGNPAQVWDAKTGVRVTALGDSVDVAVFSPDGKQLFTGGEHGTAHVWDTATWKELLTWNTKAANGAFQPPQATATAHATPATQVAPASTTAAALSSQEASATAQAARATWTAVGHKMATKRSAEETAAAPAMHATSTALALKMGTEQAAGATATYQAGRTLTVQAARAANTFTAKAARTAASFDATATARAQWPVVLADSYTQDTGIWWVGNASDAFGTCSKSIANGKYIWNVQAAKDVARWQPVDTRPLTSLYLTMEGRLLKGPGTARYGLVFRVDSRAANFYELTIDDNQRLVLALRNAGTWNYLFDHSGVRAIRPGAMNRLSVSAEGSRFQMFVNDQFAGAWDDATLMTGGVGLVMELQVSESAAAEFDNFEVRAPP